MAFEDSEKIGDLVKILLETNAKMEEPVDSELLNQILMVVIKLPLPDDRAEAQERIYKIFQQVR